MDAENQAEKEEDEYKMEVKQVSHDKERNRFTFLVKDASPGFVNSIRRTIIESVPVMAIEDVEFKQNSSVMYDEMVALRLGLISLKTDLSSYNLPADCTCKGEGCAKCTIMFTLSAKGPCTVYASDLKSKDPAIVPVYPETPIVKLAKGQELDIEAKAQLGLGSVHAKWVPAFVYHTYEPKITVNNNSPKLAECKDKLPSQIFDGNKINEKKIVELGLVDAVDGVCEEVIKVEFNESNFLLTIESFGQLSVKDIFKTALSKLKSQSEEFVKAIQQ